MEKSKSEDVQVSALNIIYNGGKKKTVPLKSCKTSLSGLVAQIMFVFTSAKFIVLFLHIQDKLTDRMSFFWCFNSIFSCFGLLWAFALH